MAQQSEPSAPIQLQYVAPVPQQQPMEQNDILNYPINFIHGILSWGVECNDSTTTLEWKRGLIRRTQVFKTANIESIYVQNVRFVSLFYLLTSFRLKPSYLWGFFIFFTFLQWLSVWITYSTTRDPGGIKFAASMGILAFLISLFAPLFFKLAGMRRVTNQTHLLLFIATGVASLAQFICSCAFLYLTEPGGNTRPDYYFLFLGCKPIPPYTPNYFNDDICHNAIYGWIISMTVFSFFTFILSCVTARLTYFLWGSAFLAHPGRDSICRVTFLGKKVGYNGLPETVILREQDAHALKRQFMDLVSGRTTPANPRSSKYS